MIQARVERDGRRYTFVADGHAGYAPTGQDIVCAAVSMLAQTLVAEVLEHEQDVDDVLTCTVKPGYVRFEVIATQAGQLRTSVRFGMVRRGMQLLEDAYPEQVKFHSDRGEMPRKA